MSALTVENFFPEMNFWFQTLSEFNCLIDIAGGIQEGENSCTAWKLKRES